MLSDAEREKRLDVGECPDYAWKVIQKLV